MCNIKSSVKTITAYYNWMNRDVGLEITIKMA